MDWCIENVFYQCPGFGIAADHLDELPEEVRTALETNGQKASAYLEQHPKKVYYQFFGSSDEDEMQDELEYVSIALGDEERDSLEGKIVALYNSQMDEAGQVKKSADVPAELFANLEGLDEEVDRLFEQADNWGVKTVNGIDLEHGFHRYDVSLRGYDQEKDELMPSQPTSVVLTDEEYRFCLKMRLTFGKECTYGRLSLVDPDLGRKIMAQVDGAYYGFNMPHDFPYIILLDELEADAAEIEGC